MIYLANAFSGQMVPDFCVISKKLVTRERVRELIAWEWESCIKDKDMMTVLNKVLDAYGQRNRDSISMTEDDILIVAELQGGRLPEGATALPEDCQFVFHTYHVLTI